MLLLFLQGENNRLGEVSLMVTKTKIKKEKYIIPESKIHQEILKKLDKNGWDLIMIGGDMVIRNQNDPQPYKYWYVIPFLGSNKEHNDEIKKTQESNCSERLES